MCLTCGCMDAHKDMSAEDLTFDDLKRAAEENETTVGEIVDRLVATVERDRTAHAAEYDA